MSKTRCLEGRRVKLWGRVWLSTSTDELSRHVFLPCVGAISQLWTPFIFFGNCDLIAATLQCPLKNFHGSCFLVWSLQGLQMQTCCLVNESILCTSLLLWIRLADKILAGYAPNVILTSDFIEYWYRQVVYGVGVGLTNIIVEAASTCLHVGSMWVHEGQFMGNVNGDFF